jgi:cyclic pyranopterin phosphate synthase
MRMKITLPLLDAAVRVQPTTECGTGTLPHRLIDSHGRQIRDLRLSLTDRCNFRCVYCMDPDVRFRRRVELLSDSEMLRLARIFAGFGVDRIRLTGGEPTLHPTLTELIADLAALGMQDMAMTTNGSLTTEADLAAWRGAGLRRLTVSLDSLRPERLSDLTRATITPSRVIETARLAKLAGMEPVKFNVVVIRGMNEDEIPDFARLARDEGFEVRFIEFMPLDSGRRWGRDRVVSADEMLERVEASFPLRSADRERKCSPAQRFGFADGAPGGIGIIASVTRPFCGACSRIRVTADGKLMPCLFSTAEWDLRSIMRGGGSDDDLARTIVEATRSKQAGHSIASPDYQQPDRPMSAIGG